MHDLCQVYADIFADHTEAECPVGPGFENPSLLGFWDNPVGSFVRFIGTMVEHAGGAQTGPCPLCKVQEDQHDYAACLRMVSLEMKGDELSVTTNRPSPRSPQPDPNPLGPTPGTTSKTPQSGPTPKSPSGGTSNKPAIMKGQYTCYGRPCVNCTDPFPAHLTSECKEPTSPNVSLRLLWQTPTHRGIQLLAQAHQWNAEQTEDQEPCEVCQKELKEHDLRVCLMRARVQSDFWGQFTVQLSNPKESLDRCPVDP